MPRRHMTYGQVFELIRVLKRKLDALARHLREEQAAHGLGNDDEVLEGTAAYGGVLKMASRPVELWDC